MSSLRESMPKTAEFIDAMREAFGTEEINAAIRKGVGGIPGKFHAIENGNEVGTPFPECFSVSGDALLPNPRRKNAD